MNILVTGATGFIGSRFIELAEQNLKEGDQLILLTSKKIKGHICILHQDYTFSTDDFMKAGIDRIDKIIHIGHFLREKHREILPVEGNMSTVRNTEYLLKHLPNVPKTFVYCSTMDVYGINRKELVDENSVLYAENPYAVSKIMIEMMLQEWADKYGVLLHILRLAHIYGPDDSRRYTIPVWLQAANLKQQIKLYTNPNMLRNCLYRDDCCNYMWKTIYLEEEVRIINLVSLKNYTMLEIAQRCKEISGNKDAILIKDEQENNRKDIGLGFKNNSLCEKYLGKEKYTLKEGLKKEWEYFSKMSIKEDL